MLYIMRAAFTDFCSLQKLGGAANNYSFEIPRSAIDKCIIRRQSVCRLQNKTSERYKMKKRKLMQIGEAALGSKTNLFISSFLFLIGISAGVFLELSMDQEGKLDAAQFLNQYLFTDGVSAANYGNPFLSSASLNIFLLVLMMLSGLSAIGFPAAHIVLIYKGMALGFSAGLVLETFSVGGVPLLLSSMLPQNLLLIPTFIIAAAAAQSYGVSVLSAKSKRYKKSIRSNAFGTDLYIAVYIVLALLVIAACLIEAFIFPFLRF